MYLYRGGKSTMTAGPLTRLDVISAFRGYATRHVLWTRAYMAAVISETGNADYTEQRCAENAREFADMIGRYYGYENARAVERFVADATVADRSLLRHIKSGNGSSYATITDERKGHVEQLARLYAAMNPNWKTEELMRYMNGQFAAMEGGMRRQLANQTPDFTGHREADLTALEMADYMAEGFIKQFGIME